MQSTLGFSSRKLHFYLYHVVKWLLICSSKVRRKEWEAKNQSHLDLVFRTLATDDTWLESDIQKRESYSIVNAFWKVMIDPLLFYLFWVVLFLNIYMYIFSVQLFLFICHILLFSSVLWLINVEFVSLISYFGGYTPVSKV